MKPNIDSKVAARNSMLDKLQNKFKKKNIQVQAYGNDEDEEDEDVDDGSYMSEEEIFEEYGNCVDLPDDWKISGSKHNGFVLTTNNGDIDLGYSNPGSDSIYKVIDDMSLNNSDRNDWEEFIKTNKITIANVVDKFFDANPLFAVAEIDGNLIGGTLTTVTAEIQKSNSTDVSIKIVTSDEKAAKAFFKNVPSAKAGLAESDSTDNNTKMLTMLTAIQRHAENAEGEISSGMFIAKELNKFMQDNGIEEMGHAVPGNILTDTSEQIKIFAEATKESAEIILSIV